MAYYLYNIRHYTLIIIYLQIKNSLIKGSLFFFLKVTILYQFTV